MPHPSGQTAASSTTALQVQCVSSTAITATLTVVALVCRRMQTMMMRQSFAATAHWLERVQAGCQPLDPLIAIAIAVAAVQLAVELLDVQVCKTMVQCSDGRWPLCGCVH